MVVILGGFVLRVNRWVGSRVEHGHPRALGRGHIPPVVFSSFSSFLFPLFYPPGDPSYRGAVGWSPHYLLILDEHHPVFNSWTIGCMGSLIGWWA